MTGRGSIQYKAFYFHSDGTSSKSDGSWRYSVNDGTLTLDGKKYGKVN